MNLVEAFSIRDKEVVAFVGGGGKTTAMFRLAEELVAQGKRVVTTTTTRIFAAQIQLAPRHWRLATKDWRLEIEKIRALLRESPHLLVVGATSEDGKALGVEPALIDELIALDEIDVVLIEADGSRMRPFKAPAEHEPVIPNSTTLLVPVVGIDAVGKTLNNEYVHRAELVSKILNVPIGTILEKEHIARVLSDARGGLKNKTPNARVIPLINKVENVEQLQNARAIAKQLLQNDAIDAVAIGAVRRRSAESSALENASYASDIQNPTSNFQFPISNLVSRISAILLAAGGSTRMRGEVKQLLAWGDTTFVGNAVRVAQASRVNEIVVVTGSQANQVKRETSNTNARVVFNPDWATGRASSVRVGIKALSEKTSGAIFINADQPFLTARVIDTVIEKFFETRAPIVVPLYDGKAGSPVLFARELLSELNALQGEQGGRDVLENYREVLARVEIADTRAALDLDTPEEYAEAKRMRDGAKDEG